MASAERKAEIDKIKQDNMFAALGAEEQQAETDAFQCSRCKQVSVLAIIGDEILTWAAAKMSLPPGTNPQC